MSFDLDGLKNFLNENDTFAKSNKIRIETLREGYAEAVLEINENSMNALNTVQGGAIFTLADLAFAAAANSWGEKCMAMNSTISFIRPGTGKRLKATAKAVNRGRRTCLFDISVTNDENKLIAQISCTGFFIEK